MSKTKTILICDKCSKDIVEAKELIDLPCLPYEWYIDKELFNKWKIYYCSECNTIYRKSQRFNNYFQKIKDLAHLIYDRALAEIKEVV